MCWAKYKAERRDGSLETHLDVVVLGPGDHQVLVVSRLIHSQTHHWTEVTNEFSCGCKSEKGTKYKLNTQE